MSIDTELVRLPSLKVKQRMELAEFIGFESRNKYDIFDESTGTVLYAAEQGKGFFASIARYMMGHWRTFELHFFDFQRNHVAVATHPFRFFFQRLEVRLEGGRFVGALQQRFALFSKRFDVEDANGRVLLTVSSPFWKLWTFPFKRGHEEVAAIRKKWGGILSEAFTDKDTFEIAFTSPTLTVDERWLLIAAAIFIDMNYFEKKAQ